MWLCSSALSWRERIFINDRAKNLRLLLTVNLRLRLSESARLMQLGNAIREFNRQHKRDAARRATLRLDVYMANCHPS